MGGDEESLKEALQCRAWQDSGIRTLNTEEVVGGPWAAGECGEKSPGKGIGKNVNYFAILMKVLVVIPAN